MKAGRWDRKSFMGTEVAGKVLGVVGLGQIGRRVAAACQAMGMTVIGFDPMMSPEVAKQYNIQSVDLDTLYAQSDFITLHTPLTAKTKHLLNDKTLAKCKDGVRIVNCARGGIVDELALLRAIESGKVAGAALDVYESEPPPEHLAPVIAHPKIICTPHLGASTEEAQEKVAKEIANQFVDAFEGRKIAGVVNSPILSELHARKDLTPFVELTDRMGALQAQLLQGQRLRLMSLRLRGKSLQDTRGLLTTAALKGVLSNMVEKSVNFINAPKLAEEFGLMIQEKHENLPSVWENSVTLVFETEDGQSRKLVGTVSAGKPVIVQVDDYNIDAVPTGHVLIFRNQDRPGLIGSVASVIGNHGVNIANFSLGREGPGKGALAVLSIDSGLPDVAIQEILNIPGIQSAQLCQFPSLEAENDDGLPPRPVVRPSDPNFGSGPCKKRPGYQLEDLPTTALGRSHRSKLGLSRLESVIERTRSILKIPEDYLVGIVPASDTGAFEMAMWSLLGPRPVDVCQWESFGKGWLTDITKQLKLETVHKFEADYGRIPNLEDTHSDHDIIFTWNGTTSGVRVPNGDWIDANRQGLTLCDATSAVFAQDLPWDKLDATTFSWQKALGGEAAHGMLILSPRAVERLESYKPEWPMPKIFRLTKDGKLSKDVFVGKVINTPSLLAVEDCIDALEWGESVGGLDGMCARANANFAEVESFVEKHDWIDFLAVDPATRSNTSVCLTFSSLSEAQVKSLVTLLEKERVAVDVGAYRDAPAGLRIWCGSTVETSDVAALMSWLEWAYQVTVESK
eukprot:TRINITY_DN2946_c0_g1_i2.p1 TRINITY_DN2946_c0_g1~~TRINITY_DN2946_c0_g1_i2.p1  ORF type:complete len:795 (+),score=173.35 TRINITY_DN2946_c0_g1_i2:164-2548(+)